MEADMKLLTLNVEPVDIEDQEYDAVLRMAADDLHKICKDFKNLSGTVRIRTTEDGDSIIFSCQVSCLHCLSCIAFNLSLSSTDESFSKTQGDMGTMQYTVNASSPETGGLEVVKSSASIDEEYPLRHLEFMTKTQNVCKRVEIYMTPGKPILLRYTFMRDGVIMYLLAPRVADEMDEE